MKSLRRMTGRTRRDRIANVRRDRGKCRVKDIVDWIQERRQLWNDHVDSMDDDGLVKRARDNLSKYKRRIR